MNERKAEFALRAAAAGVAEAQEDLFDAEVQLEAAAAQARVAGIPDEVIDSLLEAPYIRP